MFQASVVCKQLGWDTPDSTFTNSFFGPGIAEFSYDDLACIGHEVSVEACYHSNIADPTCNEDRVAGVICEYYKS